LNLLGYFSSKSQAGMHRCEAYNNRGAYVYNPLQHLCLQIVQWARVIERGLSSNVSEPTERAAKAPYL